MKRRVLASSAMMSLLMVSPALAAGREDNSGLVVWAFLGFCALIVVAQLVPALLVALGLVKGAARHSRGAEAQPVQERSRH